MRFSFNLLVDMSSICYCDSVSIIEIMKLLNKLTSGLAVLTIVFTMQKLSGQDAATNSQVDNSEILELEDFVVKGGSLYTDQFNALKTPTPIIDVPQSLSIITSDDIALRGFNSIGNIIDYTPGVNNSQGEGHRDSVVFRGIRSTADFFVDGIRDDVQYYRPLYNIEQLEILRGPNALFFGRGGTGGIINRVTKKGVIGENFNAYIIGADSFGATDVQLDSNVGINEKTAFRINLFYEDLENHRDFFDGDRYGVNPTFRFQPVENTTIDLSYEYIDHERFIDRGIPTGDDGKPVEDFEKIVFGDPELNESTLEAHIIRALLQHKFSDNLKANFSASYGDYDKFYENLYASGYDQTDDPDQVTLDGYADATERQNTVLSGNLIGEFFTADIEHTVIFGAEYIDTSSDQNRLNALWSTSGTDTETFLTTRPLSINGGVGVNSAGVPTTVAYSGFNDDTRSDIEVYSVYIQDEIQLLEQLQLVLGARFDSFDISVVSLDELGNKTQGSQKDEEITPRLGIIYKPKENISVYASYSETFLPQSGEQFANLGDEGLDPDEFTNLEAGIKWDFSKGISLTTSIFEIQQDIIDDDDGEGGSITVESEITGFEAQLQGQLTDKWYIIAGYSYLDGELADGNRPRELPENMFSVWNTYQLTEQLGLGLGLIYQDESFIAEDNEKRLPSYVRLDAAAYYFISENVRLQLNIENLTDELYFPNSHADHQATVGAPINARFSVSGRF